MRAAHPLVLSSGAAGPQIVLACDLRLNEFVPPVYHTLRFPLNGPSGVICDLEARASNRSGEKCNSMLPLDRLLQHIAHCRCEHLLPFLCSHCCCCYAYFCFTSEQYRCHIYEVIKPGMLIEPVFSSTVLGLIFLFSIKTTSVLKSQSESRLQTSPRTSFLSAVARNSLDTGRPLHTTSRLRSSRLCVMSQSSIATVHTIKYRLNRW